MEAVDAMAAATRSEFRGPLFRKISAPVPALLAAPRSIAALAQIT